MPLIGPFDARQTAVHCLQKLLVCVCVYTHLQILLYICGAVKSGQCYYRLKLCDFDYLGYYGHLPVVLLIVFQIRVCHISSYDVVHAFAII